MPLTCNGRRHVRGHVGVDPRVRRPGGQNGREEALDRVVEQLPVAAKVERGPGEARPDVVKLPVVVVVVVVVFAGGIGREKDNWGARKRE